MEIKEIKQLIELRLSHMEGRIEQAQDELKSDKWSRLEDCPYKAESLSNLRGNITGLQAGFDALTRLLHEVDQEQLELLDL
jgi:hypothetical protein